MKMKKMREKYSNGDYSIACICTSPLYTKEVLSPSLSLNTLVNIHYCMQSDVTAQRFGLTSDT